jgi:hypothetical protein
MHCTQQTRIDFPVLYQQESGHECIEFMGHFRGWVAAKQQLAQPAPQSIDPYDLREEDYSDVKAAENALLRTIQGTRLPRPPSMPRLTPGSSPTRDAAGTTAGAVLDPSALRAKAVAAAAAAAARRANAATSSAGVTSATSSTGSASPPPVSPAEAAAAAAAVLNEYDVRAEKIIRAAVSSLASELPSSSSVESRYTVYSVKVEDLGRPPPSLLLNGSASSSSDSHGDASAESGSVAAAAAIELLPPGERWECHRTLDDFLALHFMLGADCRGMRNAFPAARELAGGQSPGSSASSSPVCSPNAAAAAARAAAAAAANGSSGGSAANTPTAGVSVTHLAAVERLSRWLQELLDGTRPLRLRSRYRLYCFLGVRKLQALAKAAAAEVYDKVLHDTLYICVCACACIVVV